MTASKKLSFHEVNVKESPQTRYVVGLDLGTTNTALAYVDLHSSGDLAASIREFPIPQLVAAGEVAEKRLLPSNVYIPGAHELPEGATKLPWGEQSTIVGELAKNQGSRVPGRMVSSAKSWLCHAGVDRAAPILPWGAPEGVSRISPINASSLYLKHLISAWNRRFPDAPLEEQDVVLTVPASFDEVARELTVRAAHEAGLRKLRLLEEPQAAFYHWTSRHRGKLAEALGESRLIMVCDVGGGTTDFTLIHASAETDTSGGLKAAAKGAPVLRRIAVGDHILLGGDNMDIALARRVEARLGARLDAAQWSMLVQSCRLAKESLLSSGGPEKTRVSVVGRGSRLVGSALSAELTRAEVLETVLDGFFPSIAPTDFPRKASRAGLTELGLPYASDPAITRHVAAFLSGHRSQMEEALAGEAGRGASRLELPRPDAVLLNGGVFVPQEVSQRLIDVMSGWFPDSGPLLQLTNEELDVAVARGAAYYGLVRRGLGLRIGGGTARAYFVGVETAGQESQGLCLIPRHLEEEAEVEVPKTFALTLGRPVRFSLYASTVTHVEKPGDLVALDEDRFVALPPIQTVLRADIALDPVPHAQSASGGAEEMAKEKSAAAAASPKEIPVRLRASLTEIGTLELWCVSESSDARWKLEFQLRAGADDAGLTSVSPMPKRFSDAKGLIDLVFGKKPAPVDKSAVKGLARTLEKVLGPREEWTTPVIRELWAALWAGQAKRRRTADHERVWLNLSGFCLRPGFGAPLDAWRVGEVWKLFEQGLQFQNETHNWESWWVFWRRISGGLGPSEQKTLFDIVTPVLKPLPAGKTQPRLKGVRAEGLDEMVRMVASLERLEPEYKVEAGAWIFERIAKNGVAPYLTWAIGRLGARVPFYGSRHTSISPQVAREWIERLMRLETPRPEEITFPLAQLARLSGDRAHDVDSTSRNRVEDRLKRGGASDTMLRLVREVVELSSGEEQKVFGESLPAGLRLLADIEPGDLLD